MTITVTCMQEYGSETLNLLCTSVLSENLSSVLLSKAKKNRVGFASSLTALHNVS